MSARVEEKASRANRKLYGETAALRVRLQTMKASRNGDCFFDALVKASRGGGGEQLSRDATMWRTAQSMGYVGQAAGGEVTHPTAAEAGGGCGGDRSGGSGSDVHGSVGGGLQDCPSMPTGALTVRELRGVLAAHFPEDAWIIGQSLAFQGDSFSFIVEDSLELTRANIAALANDAADRAYWADESAIGVLQVPGQDQCS